MEKLYSAFLYFIYSINFESYSVMMCISVQGRVHF